MPFPAHGREPPSRKKGSGRRLEVLSRIRTGVFSVNGESYVFGGAGRKVGAILLAGPKSEKPMNFIALRVWSL
jgi:hypothetical protein